MDVLEKLYGFYNNWRGEKGIIGYSALGSPLYRVTVKKSDKPVVIAQYGMHAREYVGTYLCMLQAEDFYLRGERGTVHFIPAVNPDGIFISLYKYPLYKANAAGVDLNVNFDADWGSGEKNVKTPGAENYIGKRPFSEPETRAIRDFTLNEKPDITLSYHSKGEEIYWEFGQTGKDRKRDYKIAKAVSSVTGYPIKSAGSSAGGYKDWCVQKLKIPALTIEVGEDYLSHPIGEEHAERIYKKNKEVIKKITELFGEKEWT